MFSFFKISLRNLTRNPQKNIATAVAIIVGFTGLILLIGYITRVENYMRTYAIYANYTGHIVIFKKTGFENAALTPKKFALSEDDVKGIQSVLKNYQEIEMHGGVLSGQGLAGNGCRSFPFSALGVPREVDQKVRTHPEMIKWAINLADVKSGKSFSAFAENDRAVIVASGLQSLLGKSKLFSADYREVFLVKDCAASNAREIIAKDSNIQLASATIDGFFNALDGEVSGTFNTGLVETENSSVLMSLDHLQTLLDTKLVTNYSVWLKDLNSLSEVFKNLKADFAKAGMDYEIYAWNDEKISPHYTGTMSFLRTMAFFIASVLTTIIIFSIINSVTITVVERGQEIGMMRSLGYKTSDINKIFTGEILLLSLASVGIGLVLGVVTAFAVNYMKIPFNPPGISGEMTIKIIPHVSLMVLSAVLILVLATVTTFLSIGRSLRRKITLLLYSSTR